MTWWRKISLSSWKPLDLVQLSPILKKPILNLKVRELIYFIDEIDQFESENQRLQKRCDNLIDTEVQNEARVIDNNESRLNQ